MAINFGLDGKSKNTDGVQEIPPNKSLLIHKLTDLPPLLPEIVKGLHTPKSVFQHFKPSIHMVFDNLDKGMVKETIYFKDMEDFDAEKVADRSLFLSGLERKKHVYFDIVNTLQNNKALTSIIKDKDAKTLLLEKIKELKKEIKNA